MNLQMKIGIRKIHYVPIARYAVFGKISAAIFDDLPVTIAMAMLFDESTKLTH